MSLKVIPTGAFRKLGAVSYSPFIVTMALSCIVSEIKRDIGRIVIFPTSGIRRPRKGVPVGILSPRLVRKN